MADCSGCPYLNQTADHALCTVRNGEVIDEAPYSTETCEHYQAYLKTQVPGGEEDPASGGRAEKRKKKRGGGGTGCLVALLVASIILFLCVLGLIGLAVFFGGSISI